MENTLIFLPVLAQVFLVILLYLKLGKVKKLESAAGNVNEERRSLYEDAWPESVLKINNCIKNQFEVPVLFYVLVLVIWSVSAVNLITHIIAWLFVISRYVHAYIHTGSNYVPRRRAAFTLGCLAVIVLLVIALIAIV